MSSIGDIYQNKLATASTVQELSAIAEDYAQKLTDSEQTVTKEQAVVDLAGFHARTFPDRKSPLFAWAERIKSKWRSSRVNQSVKKLFVEKSDEQ